MARKARVVLGVLLTACGGGDASPAEPPARDDPEVAPVAEDERARVISEAEAFVRAQGYADTPATARGDEVVHEGIEGTIDDRRNQLDPHAVSASGANGEWSVIFRYRDPQFEGRGRMLRMRSGQRPAFVHQDVLVSAFLPEASP